MDPETLNSRTAGGDLLLPWQSLMSRGTAAARQGHVLLALASFQEALGMARALLTKPGERSDDCVAALVVSHHNLAEVQLDAGGNDLAAAQLASAHETLMHLLCNPTTDGALRQAALRHSRETHAALLLYLEAHGAHPMIARALRAGCLGVALGSLH
ncbi:hypothetical protein [Pseudorhodoferax soli]|uniref:hypothetical protein n=1 Tax=Pseudorhodoferax soli TaxID=545864 RepID=UPI0011C02535|nr:hypothetical protein [Pseudorhodoferax soli]